MSRPNRPVSLQSLKEKQLVWQGRASLPRKISYLESGYEVFDQALSGGWPASGLIELTPNNPGIGELRLLLPAIAKLAEQRPLQAWVGMPALLSPHNLPEPSLERCLLIQPKRREQIVWVLEQLLSSACCSSVVFWASSLSPAQAKRLQVAAKESGTLVFMIRTGQAEEQSLPVSLRLRLDAFENGLQVTVCKRQNHWPVAPFTLDLSKRFPQLYARQRKEFRALAPNNVVPFPASI